MTDQLQIDGEKLSYHPARVAQWAEAQDDWEKARKVYPVYIEVSPMGACNHRCTFCAVDYIGYQMRKLDIFHLKRALSEMGAAGVKSVMFAGEGEPLLFKPLAETVVHSAASGLDVGITTNAVPLTRTFCEEALGSVQWIKASVNAGSAETYAKIHKTDPRDFERALRNMETAAVLKESGGLKKCRLGIQMVLLPENAGEAHALAQRAKEIGVDYVVIKPYSQHLKGISRVYEGIEYSQYYHLAEHLEKLNDDRFHVVFRRHTMEKLQQERSYSVCQATPFFWAYIMANGDLYGCSAYLNDTRFCYGNIHEQGFREIWEGEKRRQNFEYVRSQLDISECRTNCRMDEVNRYLWKVRFPPEHISFI
ncbi:MAG: radical SAM protein [Deltaproteobacteria bacterium]|nr:radical SAM protein [Deltaproteobacteria bacterium]